MTDSPASRLLIVGPEDGETYWAGTNRVTIQAEAAHTDGHYGLVVSRAPVGSSPPLHIHGADEAVWLSQGQVRFRCGDEEFSAGPGTFALLPRGVPHSFLVEGDTEAVLVTLLSPGGSERFFAEAGPPVTSATPPPLDRERLQRAARKYDNQVVGPPMTG